MTKAQKVTLFFTFPIWVPLFLATALVKFSYTVVKETWEMV